jgi:hypothetical protein
MEAESVDLMVLDGIGWGSNLRKEERREGDKETRTRGI